MRVLALSFVCVALIGCDTSVPVPCFLGAETEVPGDISYRITSPSTGDTLRVGEAFRFRAEVEASGDVSEIGVELTFGTAIAIFPESVLFERELGGGEGSYVLDQPALLDTVRAGADLSEVYVAGAGRVLVNTACGGGYAGAGYNPVRVTVLP